MTIVSNVVDVNVEEIIELVEEGEITMIDWMDGYQVHYIEEVNHKFGKYELQDECGGCFRHVSEQDILDLYKDHSH